MAMRSWLLLGAAAAAWAQDPLDIVRRSVQRDRTNWNLARDYTYQERVEKRQLDRDGRVNKIESETYDVIVLVGRPYSHLIERNDKPLSGKEANKEQDKIDKELARRERESARDKARHEREREEARKFLREIPNAYDFRLLGEEQVSGQAAWVIGAEPKTGYRPPDARAKILAKVRGKVWIAKDGYNWVKLDAETTDTLSFGMFLVRLGGGSRLIYEQARVNDEIWLPRRLQAKAEARLALLKKMRGEFDVTYRNYKKFQTDSRIVPIETEGR